MTQRDDLDRLLGDWLSEGPARTPEPVLATAVQHARSHPRRPDPLGFLRGDPMAARTSWFGLAPVPVFAVLGLLLVALGIAVVGGQRGDVPPVVPGPTPGPTADASTPPTPRVDESPRPSFPIRVGLQTGTDAAMFVDVTDASGLLVDARTGTPADGGSVPAGIVEARNIDERTVLLTWTDAVCDVVYSLQIETTTSMTLTAPPCEGDSLALDRRLLLQFAVPVDASLVNVELLGLPAPSASAAAELPGIATTEVPGGASPMTVTLRGDPSVVTGIRAATPGELAAAPLAERPSDLVASTLGASELVVAWTGGACDVSATLTVQPESILLAEDPRPSCDAVAVGKGVVLTFVEPVDAAERALTLLPAGPN